MCTPCPLERVPICPAQPAYPGVPLPQLQHHERRALPGVLRALVQEEVLEDERLGPRGGCGAPQGLGALAVVQEDQPEEGVWGVEEGRSLWS